MLAVRFPVAPTRKRLGQGGRNLGMERTARRNARMDVFRAPRENEEARPRSCPSPASTRNDIGKEEG